MATTGAEILGMGGFEGTLPQMPDLPHPKTPEEAAKLDPGTEFIDPHGEKRVVPYRPKSLHEADQLPEGVQFIDPEGVSRTTPKYEGLDFTTQTLYNMAATDEERRKVLEHGYPGKVKKNERTSQYYVDDEGTLRRAKGFTQAPGAFLASQAAPVIGSIAGETIGGVGGAVGGSAVPVAGTIAGGAAGAIAGGAVGGAAGQGFNDAILALAGIYDRTAKQEAGELALSGAFGGVGAGVGRAVSAVAPSVKGFLTNTAPKAVADILGASGEGMKTGAALREQGVLVPPSPMFPEAPHIINVVEVFDPAFRTQKPLLQSATNYYEKEGAKIVEGTGAKVEGKLSDPKAAVSTEKTGEALLGRTRQELQEADARLRAALDARRAAVQTGAVGKQGEHASQLASLQAAEADARKAAQTIIDEGFNTIKASSDEAMKAAKAGHNSGDLWWRVGEQLKLVRAGIQRRASKMYNEADELAGGLVPDSSGLAEKAEEFLAQLPEGFEGKYPTIVKQIRDIAGVRNTDKEDNIIEGWKKEPVQPTWVQLHNLRSVLRSNYNRLDLTPDVKQGTYKFFANRVDEILNDTEARPELKEAAASLRKADDFYRENMGPLTDRTIQAVMDGLESGMPADPKVLFNTVVKEGRSELTKKIASLVGDNLWAGVKAADVQDMLDQSKTLIPGQIDGKRFAAQVLDRERNGMLEAVHGKQASDRLLRQAQYVAMLDGKLPLSARPGDTMTDIISKAVNAAEQVKQVAKQDPLGTLNREMKTVERDHAREIAKMKALQRNDPLAFLYQPTTGASEAVDRILGSEDLILAAASKFGQRSPEFQMLRQVWTQKLLTNTLEPGERLAKVSEEVQRIMFPGVSLDQMRTLAKNMDFLMSSRAARDTAKSMAAVSKVEHPWGSIPLGKAAGKLIPGFDFAGRYMLGKYYKMVTKLVNNPAFLRWVERGLNGDEASRQMVRETLQRQMARGGILGAGIGQSQFQTPNKDLMFGERKNRHPVAPDIRQAAQ